MKVPKSAKESTMVNENATSAQMMFIATGMDHCLVRLAATPRSFQYLSFWGRTIKDGRREPETLILNGICWRAETARGRSILLGKWRYMNWRDNHLLFSLVMAKEYPAKAGDPIARSTEARLSARSKCHLSTTLVCMHT